jgi:hypothetical protein
MHVPCHGDAWATWAAVLLPHTTARAPSALRARSPAGSRPPGPLTLALHRHPHVRRGRGQRGAWAWTAAWRPWRRPHGDQGAAPALRRCRHALRPPCRRAACKLRQLPTPRRTHTRMRVRRRVCVCVCVCVSCVRACACFLKGYTVSVSRDRSTLVLNTPADLALILCALEPLVDLH